MIRLLILLVITGSPISALQVHPPKYIAGSYFENHHSLIDSEEFSSFVQNEIPLDLHKLLEDRSLPPPELSLFKRDLVGEGSHRTLSSSISFNLHQELKSELFKHDCKVITIERLPSGVFADPFELQHLVQRGVFKDAAAFGDTNLELPSFRSNRSVVEVHMNVSTSQVIVRVPLHARYPVSERTPLAYELCAGARKICKLFIVSYAAMFLFIFLQALGVNGFSRVEFEVVPDVFICCSSSFNESCSHCRSCLLVPTNHVINGGFNSSSLIVVWEIPRGNEEHARVVSFVTFSVAATSALLIILATICSYSGSQGSEKPKHS